jgi:hypothetical protein
MDNDEEIRNYIYEEVFKVKRLKSCTKTESCRICFHCLRITLQGLSGRQLRNEPLSLHVTRTKMSLSSVLWVRWEGVVGIKLSS